MRILHIVGSMDPARGGPTEAIRMIIHYRPSGYHNEVVTQDDPAAPFLKDFPFEVHAMGSAKGYWYSRRLIPWLRANRDRFDGVVVHGLWNFTAIATLLTIVGRQPYLVFAHGMLDPYFKRRFPLKHIKKWLFWVPVQYWVLRFANRVLFTAAAERDLATQSFWLWRWNPMVVSYGADDPVRETELPIQAFYERCPGLHRDDEGQRILLFLGRIVPKKACDLLLQAFAAVASDNPELHLVMAGPDPTGWRGRLQAIADVAGVGHRVHWAGMLRGEAKWGALAACDAFILPSHQENFGIAVTEALAYGHPVLISDQINIWPEIAADGCGLVEQDTLDGTIRLIDRWLALSVSEQETMSLQARSTFAARYNMHRNCAQLFKVFETISTPVASAPAPEARS